MIPTKTVLLRAATIRRWTREARRCSLTLSLAMAGWPGRPSMQLHNSFQARLGLTASRAPTHRPQYIPPFSLYWICILVDYLDHFDEREFMSRFMPAVDAVLSRFHSRLNAEHQLVKSDFTPGIWNFVDWTEQWKPYGFAPVYAQTGFSTFVNGIYAYTLRAAAGMVRILGRPMLAEEYLERADHIASAMRRHCFDGNLFTDSIASAQASADETRSQHSQIWAVLGGAVTGSEGAEAAAKDAGCHKRINSGKSVHLNVFLYAACAPAWLVAVSTMSIFTASGSRGSASWTLACTHG